MSARILGIDPGLRVTGYGAIEASDGAFVLLEAGIVAPDVRASLGDRLALLHRGICDVVEATQPDAVVIEEVFSGYRNPLTALMMGHARGVLCLAAAQQRVTVHALAHSAVKRALTGSGAARKEQVRSMVVQLLGLRTSPEPIDVSDALALALAFAHRDGRAALNGEAH
ncbi:MAG: crossover junction endodeoxyribonuclease RuvC [Candidatus Eremiobacteraeota bacterium]|nr:crossover junction endodeoxyribonuclease RuvC [Candidatus Eremiobacteraeota bacterium]